jgi:hypothetical protein
MESHNASRPTQQSARYRQWQFDDVVRGPLAIYMAHDIYLTLSYNDVQTIKQQNLQLRSSTVIHAGGMFFS